MASQRTGSPKRGATASRSAFRAKRARAAKPKVKAARPGKAKPGTAKQPRAQQQPRAKQPPAAKPRAKRARPAAKPRVAAKQARPAAKPRVAAKQARPAAKPRVAAKQARVATKPHAAANRPQDVAKPGVAGEHPGTKQPVGVAAERPTPAPRTFVEPVGHAAESPDPAPRDGAARVLGEIRVPSGTLAIFDVGLVGYLPREALAPAIVTCAVPPDRLLRVVGTLVGKGRFAACWDHVAIEIGAGEVVHARKLGEAGVDFARLICMDLAALDAWQHDDSLDGQADLVFWGRDARLLGHVLNAPRLAEGYGWVNLPIAEAEAKADVVARKKAENKWLLASDLRPHSHHYYALAAARQSSDGAGLLDLAGTRLLLLFTSWGDGVFPIFLDVDHEDRPVQVRIQLATTASNAALTSVNDRRLAIRPSERDS